MTKELREKMAALRAVAPKLNATTDEVGKIVKAVEDMLTTELNLSVNVDGGSFEASDSRDSSGQSLRTTSWLAYGRIDGKYRLFVATELGELDSDGNWISTLTRTETPWASCPRDTKLRSFVTLPDLLGRIADEAERLNEAATRAASTVSDLLNAMRPELPPVRGGGSMSLLDAITESANQMAEIRDAIAPVASMIGDTAIAKMGPTFAQQVSEAFTKTATAHNAMTQQISDTFASSPAAPI